MRKLLVILTIWLFALSTASAQDWRNDDDTNTRYDCEVIDTLIAEHGDELLFKYDGDSTLTLREFMEPLFAECQEPAASDTDAEPAAETDPPAADAEMETVILEDDKIHTLEDEGCVVAVDARFDDDFNVSITGNGQDGLNVDVYLPGETEALVLDHSDEYSVNIGQDFPVRIEWAEGDDFPMGTYTFVVSIDDNSYRFQYDRQDPAYRTFVLTCYRDVEGEGEGEDGADDGGESGILEDEETRLITGTGCFIETEAWDEDFNVIIIGEPQDDISVAVYFPGEIRPETMDDDYADTVEDGTRYRVEWISGSDFPLGLYNIEVTIEDEVYPFKWQREDEDVNSVTIECIADEDS